MVTTFGEVMLRLSTEGYGRFTQADRFSINYGGSEANVAVSLSNMGVSSSHVTIFPENDLGKAASQSLRKEGVNTDYVYFQPGRMGLYFLESAAMQRSPQIIYDRANSAFANLSENLFDWERILKGVKWFHWTGITPAISQEAANALTEALRVCENHEIRVSGDINYRRNLWQYGKKAHEIMPDLIAKTNVIIAGVTDFENCLQLKATSFEEAASKAREKYPKIEVVATTARESISASHNKLKGFIWQGNKTTASREYDITHIVDRIGGGDAFMAGLIYGMMNFSDNSQIIEYATAASVLKHSISGDVNLITPQEVKHLVTNNNVGKLLR